MRPNNTLKSFLNTTKRFIMFKIFLILFISHTLLQAEFVRTRPYKIDIQASSNENSVSTCMNFDIWQTPKGALTIGSGLKINTYTNDVVKEVQVKLLNGRKPSKFAIGWDIANLTLMTKAGIYLRVTPLNFMIADIDEGFNPSAQLGWKLSTQDLSLSFFVGSDISDYRKVFYGIGFWF